MRFRWIQFLGLIGILQASVQAAVLPENRADALYHNYTGGGVEISGPSVLVRKKFGERFSASFNYYVDNVSSASIDVVTTASRYNEKRDEQSARLDFLNQKTLMSVGLTKSTEKDFDASTVNVNFAQEFFGDLTTLTMGFARGDNTVSRNGDAVFKDQSNARNYRLSLTQILSKNMIMALAFENISDQGYLNNPYRSVRYLDATQPTQYSFQSEVYPRTRDSDAFAVSVRYHLQPRAVLYGGYRFYSDSWAINANTFELGYVFPYRDKWIFDTSLRYYVQDHAEFYADLFPFRDAQNFLARDKELSSFNSLSFGSGFSYALESLEWQKIKRGSLNLHLDYIQFNYDDFRDLTVSASPGNEPLYSFNATVIRAFASLWF